MLQKLKKLLFKHRVPLLFAAVYILVYLIHLTKLPIFNDEAIYLDWGLFNVHIPGHLYDSLTDAKQPLLLWVFGVMSSIFSDPLFAGRLVSVVVGLVTVWGIYKIAAWMFDKKTALIAAVLYTIVPIFVFYNRQALMEASIACVGIWSFVALTDLLKNPSYKNSSLLGLVLGIGFFIKSSALIFIISSILTIMFFAFKNKRLKFIESSVIVLFIIMSINILLVIDPVFWQTLASNSRYSYTLSELIHLPFAGWITNITGFFNIGIFFVTPLIFLFSGIGLSSLFRNKVRNGVVFLSYFALSLLLEIFLGRTQNQRYLVPYLPFLVIPASLVLVSLWTGNVLKKSLAICSVFIPLVLSLFCIIYPARYILELSKVSSYADTPYIYGQTSGYGVNEAMQYIKSHTNAFQQTMVLIALNTGNPESAIALYALKTDSLAALHFDKQYFPELSSYTCLSATDPVFFVTRDSQQAGMEKYLSLVKKFPNPYSDYYVGIYTLKKNCVGKTLSLMPTYSGPMQEVLEK